MELRVLEYFLAIAREQNISAAAEFLHLSSSAVVEKYPLSVYCTA